MIVGKMGQKSKELIELAKQSLLPIQVITENRNIASEMLKSDLAIVSCGSTMWELMYMKVTFLAVSLTQTQRDYMKFLAGEGLCMDLGWHEDLTPDSVRKSVLGFIHDKNSRIQIRDKVERVMDRRNIGKDLLDVFR